MSVTDKLAAKLPKGRGGSGPVVAVVKLHGVITPTPSPLARGTININTVESALTRAFEHERLKAVALAINSPAGATHPTSAHAPSLGGSIGVVTAGFGLNGLLERVGVERRVYTAGAHKVRLDPFRPEKDEDVEWLKGLQTQLHDQLVGWVKARRGDRLASEDDLFTGEVWTGAKAAELGLVDGVGNMRAVIAERYPDAEISVAEPKRPLLARLGLGGAAAR